MIVRILKTDNNTCVYLKPDNRVEIVWDKADAVEFNSIEDAIKCLREENISGTDEWWVDENEAIIRRLEKALMNKKLLLTLRANYLADVHAFDNNMPVPKDCLREDIQDIQEDLDDDELQFVQKQYEKAFYYVRKGMLYSNNS